jgi:hypothetical protein
MNGADTAQPSSTALVMGMEGEAVANSGASSVERRGFRIILKQIRFPLEDIRVDVTGPWQTRPDNALDQVGVFTVLVEPVG